MHQIYDITSLLDLMHLAKKLNKMRWIKSLSVLLVAMMMWSASCKDTTKSNATAATDNEVTVAFYNVENIFDTENDPKTNDEDFTPTGKLEWTNDRYAVKLRRTAEAMKEMDTEMPDVLGLCEIENRKVIEDLIAQPELKGYGYTIIHQDSPDERGIDVALIYKKAICSEVKTEYLRIEMAEDPNERTRDILHAELKVGNENIHFFVNHWPSRSGGQAESEFKRIAAARTLRTKVDALKKENAKIIIMGDFNDHPDNKSVLDVLGASEFSGSGLYNLAAAGHRAGEGSYWYKGSWGALDQFIVSPNLMEATQGWSTSATDFRFVKSPLLLFTDSKGVARPNRTYVGDDYKAGYSDHLPIVMKLKKK